MKKHQGTAVDVQVVQRQLSAKEAASALGLGVREIQKLAGSGRLEAVKGPRQSVPRGQPRVFYTSESVERELEFRQRKAAGELVATPGNGSSAVGRREAPLAVTRATEAQAEFLTALPALIERFVPPPLPPPRVDPPDWQWMPVPQAAELIALPAGVLYARIREKRLGAIKVNSVMHVKWSDVKALEA